MMRRFGFFRSRLLWLSCLVLGWAGSAWGQLPKTFHGSEAFFDFRKGGHEMLDERLLDLDGDGLLDSLVVEQSAEGVGLSVWKAEPTGGYRFFWRSEKVQASALASLKQINMDANTPGFLLDVFEDSPDEADHWIRLFVVQAGMVHQAFETRFRVTHSEEDAGRTPWRIVDLGLREVGMNLAAQAEGWPNIVVYHDPKTIVVHGQRGDEIHYVIGIREDVFAAKEGKYVLLQERYQDYLPLIATASCTATSIYPGKNDPWIPTRVADGRIDSAWAEGRPGPGIGESITLMLDHAEQVRMIRVVPGCAGDLESWQQFNRLKNFTLTFDNGSSVVVDREKPSDVDQSLEAWGDFALPGRSYGVQTVMFLKPKAKTSWVKLTINSVEGGTGEEDVTCISEISIHQVRAMNSQ